MEHISVRDVVSVITLIFVILVIPLVKLFSSGINEKLGVIFNKLDLMQTIAGCEEIRKSRDKLNTERGDRNKEDHERLEADINGLGGRVNKIANGRT